MSSTAIIDPVHALRAATQHLHERLDSQLPLARPADAAESLRRYHQHLQVLHGWLLALAPQVAPLDWGAGDLAALQADLADAGLSGDDAGAPLPAPTGLAAVWGMAYVVEGSQLGGRVLLKRLHGAGVQAPLRYLQGRGAGTGAHWQSFLQALRVALAMPQDLAAAQDGARWAFEDLLARFARRGLL